MRNRAGFLGLGVLGLLGAAGPALAIGDGARVYQLVPDGAQILIFPYYHLDGNATFDPSATVQALRNASPDRLTPAPLAMVLQHDEAPWTSLEIQGAEKFPGLSPVEPSK